ncbi:RNA-directed DNA polymerase, eukaryota, partial [Tanacetum coccineum]
MGSLRSKEDDVNRVSTSILNVFNVVRFGVIYVRVEVLKRQNSRGGYHVPRKDGGDMGKSFVNVVKSNTRSGSVECDSTPAIVLDEECLYSKDLTISLLGRVKEFASLTNLKTALQNEGFADINEVPGWVPELLEEAEDDENLEDGFMEGVNKTDDAENCGENSDVAEIPETNFDESIGMKKDQSNDPFGVYSLLKKNRKENNKKVVVEDQSLKYPPGFTPNDEENDRSVHGDKSMNCNEDENNTGSEYDCVNLGSKGAESQSVRLKSQRLHETKMEMMEVFCVRNCWGNYDFDFIHSNSVGNSGRILCMWDPNSFRKSSSTILDYFVIVRGVWRKSGTNLIIIAVYAPHDPRDKRMLWDYLMHVINQWNGEVIIMGDFNEVRYKSDRFGSIFNSQGADEFNSFIVNAGLEEVPLGG